MCHERFPLFPLRYKGQMKEKRGSAPSLNFVVVTSCFLVFTSSSCQPKFGAKWAVKRLLLLFLAYFLYHSFFGSFPCSLLSPGDIFGLHTFLSLYLSSSYFLPYMAVSPDVVTAHIWTFTRLRCNAEWITTTHTWRRSLCRDFALFLLTVIRKCTI